MPFLCFYFFRFGCSVVLFLLVLFCSKCHTLVCIVARHHVFMKNLLMIELQGSSGGSPGGLARVPGRSLGALKAVENIRKYETIHLNEWPDFLMVFTGP